MSRSTAAVSLKIAINDTGSECVLSQMAESAVQLYY